ncbi:MAG: penicillin-binding transpeptidase domain-containing protein [Mycobacteriales bacterium]
MGERVSRLRLSVLGLVVLALLVTLLVRLAYVQTVQRADLTQTANRQQTRDVVLAAPRGQIVDDAGRPLADNRSQLVVSIDPSALTRQADGGAAMLARTAALTHIPLPTLRRQITACAPHVPKPCWTGTPYEPVPILDNASAAVVLRISEHREDFPGVVVATSPVRQYPQHFVAGQQVGYIGPVTADEVGTTLPGGPLHPEDLVGRAGIEQTYDGALRGRDGIRTVTVDNRGIVTGTARTTNPTPGNTVVTSIDTSVQKLAEQALAGQLAATRARTDRKTGKKFAAPAGAAVVVDARTGHLIALASNPDYDPNVFIGGISEKAYAALTGPTSGDPLVSRAVAGQFAPGSTFKLANSSTILTDGQASTDSRSACPPSLLVGNKAKTNYDSESLPGQITVAQALAFSCDTFFYGYAIRAWNSDQARIAKDKAPVEAMQAMARAYGFGTDPGLDVPAGEQTAGRIPDRATLRSEWDQNKAQYCANAKQGYPGVTDPAKRAYFTELAKENCTDGWRFRIGEAADMAIGQGETTVSPLQLAMAYTALVDGGRLYAPTIGTAIVDPSGHVVKTMSAPVRRTVPVSPALLTYIRQALTFGNGLRPSGEIAFGGFPLTKHSIGGKTGTAEAYGKQDTSWFASWSPARNPRYVVVGMIEQAGTGSTSAAPMVRKIYDGLYGVEGSKAVLPGGVPRSSLPHIAPYAGTGAQGQVVGSDDPDVAASPTSATQSPAGTPAVPHAQGRPVLPFAAQQPAVTRAAGHGSRRDRRRRDRRQSGRRLASRRHG